MGSFNIWAVGRNYAEHAKELGNLLGEPDPNAEPMIFLKAGSSSVNPGSAIRLPSWSNDLQHELEIALRFGSDLQFSDFAIALDLTARDLQTRLKNQGHPWTLAKSFIDSCPLGTPIPMSRLVGGVAGIENLEFSLLVNGERRQLGFARDMLFKAPRLRDYLVARFPIRPGDWLLTGTPAGVSALHDGDVLEASIHGYCHETWNVTAKRP